MADNPTSSRLAQSAYNSPYSRAGAPTPHPNCDPYEVLRSRALATLEAMGYDPKTMVEHGVVWAEDQDPYGHVMHSQYMHWAGSCLYRIMEGYDEWLSDQECADMIQGKTLMIVVKKYELDIRRQVKYPDSVGNPPASAADASRLTRRYRSSPPTIRASSSPRATMEPSRSIR